MSQQILRNPKSVNHGRSYVSSKHDTKENLSPMILTKIKNPLMSRFALKQERNFPIEDEKSSKCHFNKTTHPLLLQNQRQLKHPTYEFNAERFNNSSDDSFMFDSLIGESRKQKMEQQIVQRFTNSRKQIQQLSKRSRQHREQFSVVVSTSSCENHKQKISIQKLDKKQMKRRRLKFYHCDAIIIRPEFHPMKVFQLSINPITYNNNPARFSFFPQCRQDESPQQSVDISFQSNNKYESVRKSKNKTFLDSFNQSPLDKLNESKHHIELLSPSFLDLNKEQSHKKYGEKSFVKIHSHEKKKIFSKKIGQYDFIDNDNDDNFSNKQQRTLNATNNLEKSSQQTIPTRSFKKRNKIFSNDKKYGLKLSRTIRYQEEINKLQDEMGVGMFHIVFQEEELLRQCCT